MEKIYVIEECLAPGVWTLFNGNFYTSKEETSEVLNQIYNTMSKYKKSFNGRVTELQIAKATNK